MRRLFWILLCIVLFLSLSAVVLAQETTPEPPITEERLIDLVEQAEDAAERAEAAAARADARAEEAGNAFNIASSLFGLFEAMSGAVGLVVPILAVAAAFLGFRRLESAQNELRQARERFEQEIRERGAELDTLRDELETITREQRESASNASLALALLPVGERQYRAQDYGGALDTYLRALKLDPENPVIHYRIGYVYTQSGELEKAEEHLSRSLELDPQFIPARAARGYVYRRMGDKMPPSVERDLMHNRAEENFLEALRTSPKLMDEDGESWWGSLGGLYRRRGQIEQAINAYERCTEVTPQSSYPFSNLALLYAQTQNREKMLETYRRVEKLAAMEVQADVDNYWAYADLIVARLALGKVREAEDVLETGLSTAPPDSPYTLESLVDTLNRLSAALNAEERQPVERVIAYIERYKARHQSQRDAQVDEA